MPSRVPTRAAYLEIGAILADVNSLLVRAQVKTDRLSRQRSNEVGRVIHWLGKVRSNLDNDYCAQMSEGQPADGIKFPMYPYDPDRKLHFPDPYPYSNRAVVAVDTHFTMSGTSPTRSA